MSFHEEQNNFKKDSKGSKYFYLGYKNPEANLPPSTSIGSRSQQRQRRRLMNKTTFNSFNNSLVDIGNKDQNSRKDNVYGDSTFIEQNELNGPQFLAVSSIPSQDGGISSIGSHKRKSNDLIYNAYQELNDNVKNDYLDIKEEFLQKRKPATSHGHSRIKWKIINSSSQVSGKSNSQNENQALLPNSILNQKSKFRSNHSNTIVVQDHEQNYQKPKFIQMSDEFNKMLQKRIYDRSMSGKPSLNTSKLGMEQGNSPNPKNLIRLNQRLSKLQTSISKADRP